MLSMGSANRSVLQQGPSMPCSLRNVIVSRLVVFPVFDLSLRFSTTDFAVSITWRTCAPLGHLSQGSVPLLSWPDPYFFS